MRGRPKKPSAQRKAEGNRGHRPINDANEPTPKGAARCPSSLSKDAVKVWKRLAPQLKDMGVLTLVDTDVLGRYCEVWVQWRAATDAIVEDGMTLDGRQRAVVKIAREAGAELTRLETVLGMSPSARASLTVAPKRKTDEPSIEVFAASKPKIVKGSVAG